MEKIVYADYECRCEERKQISLIRQKILTNDEKEIKRQLEIKGVNNINDKEIKEYKEKYNLYVDKIFDNSEIQNKIIIDIHGTTKYKERIIKKSVVKGRKFVPYSLAWVVNENKEEEEKIDDEYYKNKREYYIEDIKGDNNLFKKMMIKLEEENKDINKFKIYFHNLKYDSSFFYDCIDKENDENNIVLVSKVETEGKIFKLTYEKYEYEDVKDYKYKNIKIGNKIIEEPTWKQFYANNIKNVKPIIIDGITYMNKTGLTKKHLISLIENGMYDKSNVNYIYYKYKSNYENLKRNWENKEIREGLLKKYMRVIKRVITYDIVDSYKIYSSSLGDFAYDLLGEESKDIFPYDFVSNYFEYYKVDFKEYEEEIKEEIRKELGEKKYNIFKENIESKKLNNMSEYNKFYNISDVNILFKSMEKFQQNIKNLFKETNKHINKYVEKEQEIIEWVKKIKNNEETEGKEYFLKGYNKYVNGLEKSKNKKTIYHMYNKQYYYDNIDKLTNENIRYFIIEGLKLSEDKNENEDTIKMFIRQYLYDITDNDEIDELLENEKEKEIYEYWTNLDNIIYYKNKEKEDKEIKKYKVDELVKNYEKYEIFKMFKKSYTNTKEEEKEGQLKYYKHSDITISSIAFNTLERLLFNTYKYGTQVNKFLKKFIVGGRCDYSEYGEIKINVESEEHKEKIKEIKKICKKLDIKEPEGKNNKISDEDRNSLYPESMSIMKCYKGKLKVIEEELKKTYKDKEIEKLFNDNYYLMKIYIIDSNNEKEYPIGVYNNKNDKGIVDWVNNMNGEIYYVDNVRLEQLYKMGKIKEFKLIEGLYNDYNEGIDYKFSVGMTFIYNKRLEYKNENNRIEKIYKLIMNSVYGKFVQKEYETTKRIVPNEYININDELQKESDFIKCIKQNNNNTITIELYNYDNKTRYYNLGIQLLSHSKNIMDEFQYVVNDIFKTQIYYTDTDSFHLPSYVVELVKEYYYKYLNKLFTSEFMGSFTTDFSSELYSTGMCICGKKQYIHKLNKNKYHFVSKGFSKHIIKKLNDDITSNIWNNKKVHQEFINKYKNIYDVYNGIINEDELLTNEVDISQMKLIIRYDIHGNTYKITEGLKGKLVSKN